MRIAQSDAARESFQSLSIGDYLQPAEQKVMSLFNGPDVVLTRKQIRDRSGMELSSVCGRVRSLLDKGELVLRGEMESTTGKANELVGLPVKGQAELFT